MDFLNNTKVEFEHFCRCCLLTNAEFYDMRIDKFTHNNEEILLYEGYLQCSGINQQAVLKTVNQSSSMICKVCAALLENAYFFRSLCQDADKTVQKLAADQIQQIIVTLKQEPTENEDNGTTQMVSNQSLIPAETTPVVPVQIKPTVMPIFPKPLSSKQKTKKSKARLLECKICKKHVTNLSSHMDTHSTESKYNCSICNKRFRHVTSLQYHQHRSHNQGLYHKCLYCKKQYQNIDRLEMHLQTHGK
jgi:hypothetical protein